MEQGKRNFLKASGAALGALMLTPPGLATSNNKSKQTLTDITGESNPITSKERKQRIAKAQKLMTEHDMAAIVLEPGSAMDYFTGIHWRRSERLTAVIIPREGDITVICPHFEVPTITEKLTFSKDIRGWHEHDSPFALVASVLKEKGLKSGKLGFEKTIRYFVLEGIMQHATSFSHVNAKPVTLACRMYKSAAELQLMHKANEITLMAYQHVWQNLELGMTPQDIKNLMYNAQSKLGGKGVWNMALLNEASAYPHGTNQPQTLANGSTVLMDCGCNVYGYQSDISRTFVFGQASKKQRTVWNTVRKGQQLAFDTAQIGTATGKVDDVVRDWYTSLGYGPGYKTPGLSHRTGHGIGLDGHEEVNFVHGETTLLAPGMCFSNEPGIYIYEEFGVRLEDCIYMTNSGANWFTEPGNSIESPIGRIMPLSI